MKSQTVQILLIEDNPGDARLVKEMLSKAEDARFDLKVVDRLSAGLECLDREEKDLVLLDLNLPDSHGLDTIIKAHTREPTVPIVVLTSLADEMMGSKALKEGAQDYLVKNELDSRLLVRSIRYAIERHRLLEILEQEKHKSEQKSEMSSLDNLVISRPSTVTAEMFAIRSLRETSQNTFNEIVQTYGSLLDQVMERHIYKTDINISEGLRSLAEQLGFLQAGPRDVIEINNSVLKEKIDGVSSLKANAYFAEGRLGIVELMGYLVLFYRDRSQRITGNRNYALPGSPS